MAKKHSKYYYEEGRNENSTSTSGCCINPKMLLSKEELGLNVDYGKEKTPNYYIGKVYGYEARKIIEDFGLSYNVGTATSYLLRAKRKHSTSVECIQKAINHLEFELDKIKNEETNF